MFGQTERVNHRERGGDLIRSDEVLIDGFDEQAAIKWNSLYVNYIKFTNTVIG